MLLFFNDNYSADDDDEDGIYSSTIQTPIYMKTLDKLKE